METDIAKRLEELRAALRAENISYGELADLQGLAKYIAPDDVELREAAGIPEFPADEDYTVTLTLTFTADSAEDAASQFAEWLVTNRERWALVDRVATGERAEVQF